MKMTSLFFFLHNKRICCSQANSEIKAKLKPVFYSFLMLYFGSFFFSLTIVYIMLNLILLCNREI